MKTIAFQKGLFDAMVALFKAGKQKFETNKEHF